MASKAAFGCSNVAVRIHIEGAESLSEVRHKYGSKLIVGLST
jgi:hypothetical protein